MRRDGVNFWEHFDQYVLHFSGSFPGIIMIDSYTGATALEFTYGRRVDGKDDPVIKLASGLAEILTKEMTGERSGLLMALPIR